MQYGMKSAKPDPDYLMDGEPSKEKNRKKGINFLAIFRYLVFFTGGLLGVFLFYRGYGLFQLAFSKWGLGSITGVCSTFNYIPFIGGFIADGCSTLGRFVTGLLALMVLLLITVLEVLPTFIYFHPRSTQETILQLRRNQKLKQELKEESGDTREIKGLIRHHNKLADRHLQMILIASAVAFFAEMWIIWVARSGRADIASVLIDSLAFELLVVAVLSLNIWLKPASVKGKVYASK